MSVHQRWCLAEEAQSIWRRLDGDHVDLVELVHHIGVYDESLKHLTKETVRWSFEYHPLNTIHWILSTEYSPMDNVH